MKKESVARVITCLTAMVLMTSSMAFGETLTATLKTEKTVYLMDPYYWVYRAAREWPVVWGEAWPIDGYPRTVTFYVNIYDDDGNPVDAAGVSCEVYDGLVLLDLSCAVDPVEGETGIYEGSFVLTEALLGADAFTGQDPKELSLKINSDVEVDPIKEHPVSVGRWGCDRCHVDFILGKELYPWSWPTGGPWGPHGWANILGRLHNPPEGFDETFLMNAEKTHTPAQHLSTFPFHEKTLRKQPWWDKCTPCHMGWGRVRYPYADGESLPWVTHAKSEAVECTFCHGIEGGYRPDLVDESTKWVTHAGYISETHNHNFVPLLPDTDRDPYLARQTCSNPGCHGHIDDDAEEGEVLHNKPNCRDCHGVHNDNF